MQHKTRSRSHVRSRAISALRDAFSRRQAHVPLDEKGYAADFRETLLPLVAPEDFVADLSAGDGNELQTKFRAVHSSSALAVNCFAPFRRRMEDLILPTEGLFQPLRFEQKCPTGLRGGRAPNLDVLLKGAVSVVGIESKLTEYLAPHRAVFSSAYAMQIRDERCEQGYFREMLRLMDAPNSYVWLDAAQLIKHSFGLANTFRDHPVTLLYLFWEPANPDFDQVFADHRQEIAEFAERVEGSIPAFKAMSYPELWASWQDARPADWLIAHLNELRSRYEVTL